jgi:predicted DNA-binding protein
MRKRNVQVIIRLTEDEHRRLKRLVARSGISQEAYIRHLIKGLVPTDIPPPDYHTMTAELRRIGNNLNQIARKAHVLGVIDVARYDAAVSTLDTSLLSITNAVMLPRRMEGRAGTWQPPPSGL